MKGELRGLGRLGEATREAGAPRISHWELALPLGLGRWGEVEGRSVMGIELL